tara:strand:- start:9 stop:416 length:408 start_codon:yes stop_codon:yes gene_type:complete
MYGKKVKLRALFLTVFITTVILTVYLIFKSLEENVLYFLSPSEIKSSNINLEKKMRIGGMVKENSIKIDNNIISFTITDYENEIEVSYSGLVPNLFQEKKGVVAEGFLKNRNFFEASKILAKHDENYMPIELKNK